MRESTATRGTWTRWRMSQAGLEAGGHRHRALEQSVRRPQHHGLVSPDDVRNPPVGQRRTGLAPPSHSPPGPLPPIVATTSAPRPTAARSAAPPRGDKMRMCQPPPLQHALPPLHSFSAPECGSIGCSASVGWTRYFGDIPSGIPEVPVRTTAWSLQTDGGAITTMWCRTEWWGDPQEAALKRALAEAESTRFAGPVRWSRTANNYAPTRYRLTVSSGNPSRGRGLTRSSHSPLSSALGSGHGPGTAPGNVAHPKAAKERRREARRMFSVATTSAAPDRCPECGRAVA